MVCCAVGQRTLLRKFEMFIDTTRRMPKTLYFLLTGVNALQRKDLSYVFYLIFHQVYNFF